MNVEDAVKRNNQMWKAWSAATTTEEKAAIKAEIDALDAQVRDSQPTAPAGKYATPIRDTSRILPNDRIRDTTVIASVVYNDDEDPTTWTLLLLHPASPYFEVAIYTKRAEDGETYLVNSAGRVENIVPAVRLYEDWGGDY